MTLKERKPCLDMGYKKGYRFVPTDVELIELLSEKIGEEAAAIPPVNHPDISVVNIYHHRPEDLAGKYHKLGDDEWYFYTPRGRKYKNGVRPSRAAGEGYWKATGADKDVTVEDENSGEKTVIGYRKALVFYTGNDRKTDWIMHEFRANAPPRKRLSPDDMVLDDYVLCKIYEKKEKKRKKRDEEEEEGVNQHPEACKSDMSAPAPAAAVEGGRGASDCMPDNYATWVDPETEYDLSNFCNYEKQQQQLQADAVFLMGNGYSTPSDLNFGADTVSLSSFLSPPGKANMSSFQLHFKSIQEAAGTKDPSPPEPTATVT